MMSLVEKYCLLYRQGFVPIFVSDRLDAVILAEAAVRAGAKAVEITCRRERIVDDIRRVRKAFPELLVFTGSVVDDGPMAEFLRSRRPEVPSLAELLDLDIDGFVSALPLSPETIARLSRTHLVIPGVETVSEAVRAVEAGAHFAKFFTAVLIGEHRRVALVMSAALHRLLPIFVTGGVTLEKIEPYVEAGAALLGSGWDVILGGRYRELLEKPGPEELADALRRYLDAVSGVRARHQPGLGGDTPAEYLAKIPHYHPFFR